jgi:hypothetical protein
MEKIMKNKTMTPLMTTDKNKSEQSFENDKKLTPEDLNYLKQLNNKTREIKVLIGEVEVQKMRLLKDFDIAISQEASFVNQLYAKYNIQEGKDFSINPETGIITIAE